MNKSDFIKNDTRSVQFSEIDYSIVGLVLLTSMGIGIYFRFSKKNAQTVDDYLFGDHKMNSVLVALSLVSR